MFKVLKLSQMIMLIMTLVMPQEGTAKSKATSKATSKAKAVAAKKTGKKIPKQAPTEEYKGQQQEKPIKPDLQVQVENKWPLAKNNFEIYIQAISGTEKSKPIMLPVDSYGKRVRANLNFEGLTGKITSIEFVIARPGNPYQHFCIGRNLVEGATRGAPEESLVVLEEPFANYLTDTGLLNKTAYPRCTVGVRGGSIGMPTQVINNAQPVAETGNVQQVNSQLASDYASGRTVRIQANGAQNNFPINANQNR